MISLYNENSDNGGRMTLNDVEIFIAISETGSLAEVARRLDISPMTVSRRLAALEQELGGRLLQRTTRSVSLTQEGIAFLPYARAMCEAGEGARTLFRTDAQASGLLRITAPSGFGRRAILPLLPGLLTQHPALRIDLRLDEEVVDIVGQGFDIAIRIAPLRDSSLIARKIVDNPRILCASPDYVQRHGVPRKMSELAEHNCLRLTNMPQWTFEKSGKASSISVEGNFSSNVEAVRKLCAEGMGIAQLTRSDVAEELARNSLVEIVLEDVQPQQLAVWAVLPTTRYLPLRARLFIEALKTSLTQTANS
jgi:DNA-binding transcriptional LysR family regulator